MKKLTALMLCLLLCLSCVVVLASCDSTGTPEETTKKTETTTAPSEDTTEVPDEETTEAPTEEVTETPTEEATSDGTDDPSEGTQAPDDTEYDPELYVVIRSAEDLMAFNKAVNEDMEFFDDMTVVFTADIDMTGYTWIPLDGNSLFNVTFEGNGHTISNLQFEDHAPEQGATAAEIGSGFVGISTMDMTFQNLHFDNVKVTAYERAVGCFVGLQNGGYIWFENCSVKNFTADGWMDYNNQDRENDGHPIAFRLAGFVGHNMNGGLGFLNCHVENIKLSGFHNMAGFVGYASTSIDEFCFENCSVKNLECTFSYCLSASYTVDMPKKYVAVFFNHPQWVDKTQDCLDMDNAYQDVYYYDWTDNNAEYSPTDFKSWTQEEADAPAA